MNRVILSPEYFPNPTIGRPVSLGNIYVGIVDLDPEVLSNRKEISVQEEDGTIVSITTSSQPLQTGAGGVPLYNGSPVTILTEGNYSLKVTDKLGAQIYYIPSQADFGNPVTTSVSDMLGLVEVTGQSNNDKASIAGFFFTSPEDNPLGSGEFVWQSAVDKATANGGTIVDPDNLGGFDGTVSSRDAFLAAQGNGVGLGCWVRLDTYNCNQYHFGAVGAGVTDDWGALQATFDNCDYISMPEGTFRSSAGLTKTGQFWTIEGAGQQLTILKFDNGTFDLLAFDNSGGTIARSTLRGFMVQNNGDKTAGASIAFDDTIINCVVEDIYVRVFWNAFKIAGLAKCFFSRITYDQFGRSIGTTGQYGFNCTSENISPSGWHLDHIEGSGFVSGATPESSIIAHINVNGCDGIYLDNSHFFYANKAIRFNPDNLTEGKVVSSFICSNTYFDTTDVNHVSFEGQADTAYQDIQFSNCLFRDAVTSHSIQTSQTGEVDVCKFTGCTWRDNFGSAIQDTTSGNTFTNLTVTGCTFDGNNIDNAVNSGDIITRGSGGNFTGNTHVGGGTLGHAVQLLTGATDNIVSSANFSESTATDILDNAGTGTRLYSFAGFVITNVGSAVILNPSTSIVIAHGLDVTPSQFDIRITPIADIAVQGVTSWWVDTVTSTEFTLHVNAAASTSANFAWKVEADN